MAKRRKFRRPELDAAETRFADLAPVFDLFPGFAASDFDAFLPAKQRNPEKNGERLVVKRKLAALAEPLDQALADAGLATEAKTSLSHPWSYNGYKVASMWLYFGRDAAAKREIKAKLGAELGKDADPTYQGVILLVEVDERRLAVGLKIHPAAWWDAKNVQHKVQRKSGADKEFASLLNALPAGYAMSMGDFKRRYESGKLYDADMRNFFQYFKPGEMWLHLVREIPRAEAIERGAALPETLGPLLAALAPVYRFMAWSPENDFMLRA